MTVRPRLLLSGILAVLVVGAGVALETGLLSPRRTGAASSGDAPSGAWFCPHGGLWQTWVTVGNPGFTTATVRVTTFGERGGVRQETFDLEAGTDRYVEIAAARPGSGTMVEYFGAPVAAGWVSRSDDGVAAESCRASAGRSWLVADGNTQTDPERSSWLIVMNPFAEDAAFDVTLLTAEEAPTRVGSLRGYVLPGRRTVAFRINRYLLGKPSVAAHVTASLGAVSVAQLGITEDVGVRAVVAVPRAARRWVLPSALGQGDSALSIVDAEEQSAAFSVRQQTHLDQRPVEALTDLSLRGPSVQTYDTASNGGPAGLVVDVTGEVPVAAARRTLGTHGDVAAVSGAATSAASWVIPPTVPPAGAVEQRFVLENPGREDVTVNVRTFGDGLVEDLGEVTIPAGRTIAVAAGGDGDEADAPVWAWVYTDSGTFVAGSASLSMERRGFALAMGVPLGLPAEGDL